MTAAVGIHEPPYTPFGGFKSHLGSLIRSGHRVWLEEVEREEKDKPLKIEACDI